MKQSKKIGYRAGMAIVALAVLMLLFANYQIKRTLKLAFANKVLVLNKSQPLEITYDHIDISLLRRSFELIEVLVLPDELAPNNQVNSHISIESISVDNFKVFPLLFNKHLFVDEFNVSGLEVVYKKKEPENEGRPKGRPKRNSENGLKRLSVEKFQVNDYQFYLLDRNTRDTVNSLQGELLSIDGIALQQAEDEQSSLRLEPENIVFRLKDQRFVFGHEQDVVSVEDLAFSPSKGHLKINGLKVGDQKASREKIQHQKYNDPVSSFSIPNFEVFGIQTDTIFSRAAFFADSLWIQDASFIIVKDVQKPWDKDKLVPLPQQALRNEKQKFWLPKIQIKNTTIDYIEVMSGTEMVIPINELNATLTNVGTVRENNHKSPKMGMQLQGKVLGALAFETTLDFPNPLTSDFFSFSGKTGPFSFESLNPVMVPSTSIKFESGNVHQIIFSGQGDDKRTKGELILKFDNLESSVLKKHSSERNKTFSWLANAAVRTENPKNGKLKTAQMSYKRLPYKGFGNYMVKTIESGLINSVYPFGRRTKEK